MSSMVVAAAGGGLIVANLVTGPQRAQLAPLWSGSGDLSGAHTVAKHVGAEVVAVGALVLWAGNSSTGSRSALAILAALWIVWFANRSTAGSLRQGLGAAAGGLRGAGSNPFRYGPGTVAPPVNTGPPIGTAPPSIPGLPPVR